MLDVSHARRLSYLLPLKLAVSHARHLSCLICLIRLIRLIRLIHLSDVNSLSAITLGAEEALRAGSQFKDC
jgi:hypothetical protein